METNLAYKLEPQEELIGGKVYLMAPARVNHNRISKRLSRIFDEYLGKGPCEYFLETGLCLDEGREEYIPDGMVVCDPSKVRDTGVYGVPDLVVEILSRSTARMDRGHKKDVYEAFGVREYWIISPYDLTLEQYVLEDGRFRLRGEFHRYLPAELAEMTERELSEVRGEFPCGIFDTLTVRLEDVFYRVRPVP